MNFVFSSFRAAKHQNSRAFGSKHPLRYPEHWSGGFMCHVCVFWAVRSLVCHSGTVVTPFCAYCCCVFMLASFHSDVHIPENYDEGTQKALVLNDSHILTSP